MPGSTINYSPLPLAKTMYLPLTCSKVMSPNFEVLNINNQFEIKSTTEAKCLGIIIDSHLKWDAHINYVIKKVQRLIYKFKRLRETLRALSN